MKPIVKAMRESVATAQPGKMSERVNQINLRDPSPRKSVAGQKAPERDDLVRLPIHFTATMQAAKLFNEDEMERIGGLIAQKALDEFTKAAEKARVMWKAR